MAGIEPAGDHLTWVLPDEAINVAIHPALGLEPSEVTEVNGFPELYPEFFPGDGSGLVHSCTHLIR